MLRSLQHPARLVPLAFIVTICIGTFLLMLPVAREGTQSAPFITALFTSTSAVCVTGLIVVDTPVYWSKFGQGVILALFQIGGFGIMSAATLLGLLAGRGFRLRDRLLSQVERTQLDFSDARSVFRLILVITLIVEGSLAFILSARLYLSYDYDWSTAIWHGTFHAVSAFNNAGFSTYSDSLVGFYKDWLFLVPVMVAILLSSLGFPVIHELRTHWKKKAHWTLHTRITLIGTAILLVVGFLTVLAAEWSNPATLGTMSVDEKLLNSAFQSMTTRSTGFNTIDIGALQDETLAVVYLLMFIGGGSAGTAGGIKVTTFFLLGVVVWSEARGERDTQMFGRRIGTQIERQALAVALLSITMIGLGTIVILTVTEHPLPAVLFEAISAFATVGLSTGITGQLPATAECVLISLMFVGRVGSITIVFALAMSRSRTAYRYPEERPIIG
jgi:trk system potassium uptake protein